MTETERLDLTHKTAAVFMHELRCYDTRTWDQLKDYAVAQVSGVDTFNAGYVTNCAIDALTAIGFATRKYDEEALESYVEIDWEKYYFLIK